MVYAADMQPGSPRSYRFRPAFAENWKTAREQILRLEPEFLLVGGDITRDGSIHRWELEEMRRDFDGMHFPCHVIPGNMDTGNKHTRRPGPDPGRRDPECNITSEQISRFENVFGPAHWSIVHRGLRVSGFCDMILGSGLPEEEGLWAWLESLRPLEGQGDHVFLSHYAFFIDDPHEETFDIGSQEHYLEWYFGLDRPVRERLLEIGSRCGLTRVITGHIHCRREVVADGVSFDYAPGIAFAQWGDRGDGWDPTLGVLAYDVRDGRIVRKRFVPLERVSTRTDGYGPGGHPHPEMRDYSLAWENGGGP
jgi:hypothetical protein